MLELTRHVFSWGAEAVYADYHERALLNGVLGTMNPADAMTTFYVPLESGYWKLFSLPFDSFWCCTGTGVERSTARGRRPPRPRRATGRSSGRGRRATAWT
jgi:hypothetical protein